MQSIALSGRSGAGKTTVAQHLAAEHGYAHCQSGAVCRQVCILLFDDDSKEILNAVTAAMQSIRADVWITAALRSTSRSNLIVFDSMRFKYDYDKLRNAGFALWRVSAPLEIRAARLASREQQFNPATDDIAAPEVALDGHAFDHIIDNSIDDREHLARQVDAGVRAITNRREDR